MTRDVSQEEERVSDDERYIAYLEALRDHHMEQLSNVTAIAARAYVYMTGFLAPKWPPGVGNLLEPIEYRCGACGGKQKTNGACIICGQGRLGKVPKSDSPSRSLPVGTRRNPTKALSDARGGACVPFEWVSCFDMGIQHGCCESLLLDGFTVEEVTNAERDAVRSLASEQRKSRKERP